MENASKALIIAGSVLVAILIIGLGMRIFYQAEGGADMIELSSTEINMFNSKFERYAGTQTGSQVKSLISFAISNAGTNGDDPIKLPTIGTATGGCKTEAEVKNYINALSTIRNNIISTSTYTVKCEYAGTGLISKITITQN